MRLENLESIAGVSADAIASEAKELLDAREWNNVTEDGIKRNLTLSLYNKDLKICQMVNSKYYNKNLQLVMPIMMKREASISDAQRIIKDMVYQCDCEDMTHTLDGLSIDDYVSKIEGKAVLSPDEVNETLFRDICQLLRDKFSNCCYAKDTMKLYDMVEKCLKKIRYSLEERISPSLADDLNEILNLDKKKITAGQKTSKVVNRILQMLPTFDNYNKKFTSFADLINANMSECYFVVSLNFMDYLRMSDGTSWASCHTTDYHNTRGMDNHYSGAYCQGCLSYANDGVSYVTYIILKDKVDPNHPDRTPKLYRCMFHVSDDKKTIIQGRVYPQGNDGCMNIYDFFWENFKKIMEFSDEYYCVGQSSECAEVESPGANYKDYYEYNSCRLFNAKGTDNRQMTIGSIAYSCADGYELDVDEESTIV